MMLRLHYLLWKYDGSYHTIFCWKKPYIISLITANCLHGTTVNVNGCCISFFLASEIMEYIELVIFDIANIIGDPF